MTQKRALLLRARVEGLDLPQDRTGRDCGEWRARTLQERLDPRQGAIACGLRRFRPAEALSYYCRSAPTQLECPQPTKGCNPSYFVHFQTGLTYRSAFRGTFPDAAEAVADSQRQETIKEGYKFLMQDLFNLYG